jgi:hypothetical protein
MVFAAAQLPEKATKIKTEMSNTILRPYKSLSLAMMSMKLVYVNRYAVTTQLLWLKLLRSSVIDTSDVLTMDISRFTRKVAM